MNSSSEAQGEFSVLRSQGELISDSLFSEGNPENWDNTNVIRIGIMDGGKVNETKLVNFNSLPYSQTKGLFNVDYDYYINFSESLETYAGDIDGVGTLNPNPRNLVKITRVVIYRDKPLVMEVHVWD